MPVQHNSFTRLISVLLVPTARGILPQSNNWHDSVNNWRDSVNNWHDYSVNNWRDSVNNWYPLPGAFYPNLTSVVNGRSCSSLRGPLFGDYLRSSDT
jgi:hypothetical protein